MIPKKIHYCWFGGKEIPEKDRKCIESWKKYCPDYEIIQWNEDNYDVSKCKYMYQAYTQQKWGFVPDYARLDIVYNEGGIYLDTDVELVKSLDGFLNLKGFMGFENENYVNLGAGFGAEKNNKVIKKMRDIYDEQEFIKADGTNNLTASPKYTTYVLKKMGLVMNNITQKVDGVTVFASDYFSPLNFLDGVLSLTENTYGIHWFNMSWKEQDEKKLIHIQQENIRKFGKRTGRFINKFYILIYYLRKEGVIKSCRRLVSKEKKAV